MPPFLKSCLQGKPLHPQEEIIEDAVRPSYEFPWWITRMDYPRQGVEHLFRKSFQWHKWMAQGGLPIIQPDIETSKLSPADIQQIKAQLEEAQQRLLDRIARAEAEEAWVDEQIAGWEDIVFNSAALDLGRLHEKRL
jgi:hypothetical protein